MLVTVLAALGVAHLLLVFLKVRGLTGFRAVSAEDTQWWGGLGLAVLAAAIGGVLAHLLFGVVAPSLVARLGKRAEGRELRTIWGLSSFPAAAGFLLLVVLDVLIAGREAYSALEGDSLVRGWAAGSLALALSLGFWSLYLFVVGLRVAADVRPAASIMVVLVAAFCVAIAAVVGTLIVVGVVSLIGLLVNVIEAVKK